MTTCTEYSTITRARIRALHKGLFCLCMICILGVLASSAAVAQDTDFDDSDPFGDSSLGDPNDGPNEDDGFGFSDPGEPQRERTRAVDPSKSSSDPLDKNLDPLIFILRENPPQTPKDFGRAIYWMTQLGHWSEVGSLLDEIASRKWKLPQLAELSRAAGDNTWIRLRRESEQLSQPQNAMVSRLFQAPANYAKDPSNLDQWIDQLRDPDPSKRRLAQVRLQSGGSAAIERLLDRFQAGHSKVSDLMLVGTIVEFGQPGIEAIQAACTVSDATYSSRVLLAISELPSNHFPVEIATALHSNGYPEELKQALARRLNQRKFRLPDLTTTANHLQTAFEKALADYQDRRTLSGQLQDLLWRVSSDGSRIEQVVADRDVKSLERTFQMAQHRANIAAAQPNDYIAYAAVGFQRAYLLDPNRQDAALNEGVLSKIPSNLIHQSDFWGSVFQQASQWQMHGSSVRTLELLTDKMQSGQVTPAMDFLSELLIDSRPVIRYLALKAIAAIDPQMDYAGSERALAVSVEMLQLNGGVSTLVIGANSELCMAADASVRQVTAGNVVVVPSGRAALQVLSDPNPADMIIIVDRVHDLSLFELLQRLRKTQGGGALPIAVMTDQLYPHETQLVAQMPGVFVGVLSRDQEAMQQVVKQMMDSLDTQPISPEQRDLFQQAADSFLAKISQDRTTYSFYPFDTWHQALIRLPTGTTNAARTQVLASLGTNQSQMRLIQMAVASGATELERANAAKAFEKSIRRFGTLLTSNDVQTAYDLYNRLGPNDPFIAKTMTFILDVIEAQAGARAWPTGW